MNADFGKSSVDCLECGLKIIDMSKAECGVCEFCLKPVAQKHPIHTITNSNKRSVSSSGAFTSSLHTLENHSPVDYNPTSPPASPRQQQQVQSSNLESSSKSSSKLIPTPGRYCNRCRETKPHNAFEIDHLVQKHFDSALKFDLNAPVLKSICISCERELRCIKLDAQDQLSPQSKWQKIHDEAWDSFRDKVCICPSCHLKIAQSMLVVTAVDPLNSTSTCMLCVKKHAGDTTTTGYENTNDDTTGNDTKNQSDEEVRYVCATCNKSKSSKMFAASQWEDVTNTTFHCRACMLRLKRVQSKEDHLANLKLEFQCDDFDLLKCPQCKQPEHVSVMRTHLYGHCRACQRKEHQKSSKLASASAAAQKSV